MSVHGGGAVEKKKTVVHVRRKAGGSTPRMPERECAYDASGACNDREGFSR